jgi:hypothetical protein
MEFRLNFTEKQIDRLSEILGNLGLLFFASIVIPTLVSSINYNSGVLTSGIIVTATCIFSSIFLAGGETYE